VSEDHNQKFWSRFFLTSLSHENLPLTFPPSSVHPHFVKTPMVEPFFDDMSDFLAPEQVAEAILDVLYSESSQQKIVPSMAGMWAGIQGYPAWLGTGFRSAMSLKYLKTSTEPRRVTVKAD
jgi:hypothetical protein